MAETIPGGAYLSADGTTWHDAEGRVLSKEQQAQAEKWAKEQAAAQEEARKARVLYEAQRDPVARALMAQQEAAKPAPRVSEK